MTTAADTVSRLQLSPSEQANFVAQVREVCRQSPLVRPKTPNGLDMRVRVTSAGRLGWVGDGAYRYTEADSRGNPWPPIPDEWLALADEVTGSLWLDEAVPGPPHFPWDSAIINWYEPGASLGWHRDQSERDTTLPIVTISLGDACSWAVREDDESPSTRTRLESGQITLLAGRARNYLHTVERIIPAPMFSPLKTRGRISITLRVAG